MGKFSIGCRGMESVGGRIYEESVLVEQFEVTFELWSDW